MQKCSFVFKNVLFIVVTADLVGHGDLHTQHTDHHPPLPITTQSNLLFGNLNNFSYGAVKLVSQTCFEEQ